MEKETISRNQMVNQLLNIGHGNLSGYIPTCMKAIEDESELFAHLIAWNQIKGEVRDSKIAFPVIALRGESDLELYENAVSHLLLLDPLNLVKAARFSFGMTSGRIEYMKKVPFGKGKFRFVKDTTNVSARSLGPGAKKLLYGGIEQYLRFRERNRGLWTSTALQHRASLKSLYSIFHIKPNAFAQAVLFENKKPKGTVFEALVNLKNMNAQEAAGTILHFKIPFIVATGALSGIKDKPDVIMALIDQMSGNELINMTDALRKMGVFENSVLKASYDEAVERLRKDKRVSTMKASKAAEKIGDEKVARKMKAIQEEKLESLGGIEGDWLILGDKSSSMNSAIEKSCAVASLIAQQVKGNVNLIFFNDSPTRFDVTGKSYEEIKEMTKRVKASGWTSIGCGLDLLTERNVLVNGIVIVSDGGDNRNPYFHDAYRKYVNKIGIEPTVYLYWVKGSSNDVLSGYCQRTGIPIQKFDVTNVDYYGFPNMIKTLKSSRYSLIDEIMEVPLLTFNDVFRRREK